MPKGLPTGGAGSLRIASEARTPAPGPGRSRAAGPFALSRPSYYGCKTLTTPNLDELRRAGELRREADRLTGESEKILAREVPKAVKAGTSISEVARVGHVSRPTIYKLLDR